MRLTYIGDAGRYYPTLGLTPVPGEPYDLETDPGDNRWAADEPVDLGATAEATPKKEKK